MKNTFFAPLKILSLILSLFLVWRIFVYYKRLDLWKKKIGSWKEIFWLNKTPLFILKRRYKRVEELLSSQNRGAWQMAILKADALVKTVLTEMGYKGKDVGEMAEQLLPEAVPEEIKFNLKLANEICHQIVEKQNLLSQEDARRYIVFYKNALEVLGIKIS
ncbi:MAG: hypothetical protein NTX26_02105 [Candidatus Parcubacteria bacterium]|nr:hypothetical protein [Candidatus Parcubacteria bacterium]